MFQKNKFGIRRGLPRLKLRLFVVTSLPFIVIVTIIVYLTREQALDSQGTIVLLKQGPTYSSYEVETDMERRRQHVQDACKTTRKEVSWFALAIVVFRPLKLAFCHVPKTGTTIWTSVYRYLNQDLFPNYVHNPFKMRKFYVHHTKMLQFETLNIFHEGRGYLDDSYNFVFVRDPFTRLFSVYIEKLFLPDMWNDLGVQIVNRFRPAAKQQSLLCGNDVTFVEFVKYVVESETTNVNQNDHVMPITKRCHFCGIKYNVIGKDETFSRDVEFTLNKTGLIELVPKFHETDWGEKLIRDLVHQTFMSAKHFVNPDCIDFEMLVSRLWKMFKLKGIFEMTSSHPQVNVLLSIEINIEKITAAALKEYNYAPPSVHGQRKKWKQSLKEAWSKVPQILVTKIQQIYKDDFEILDYDPYPRDIFD